MPTSPFAIMLSNPFTFCPLLFCSVVLLLALFVPVYVQLLLFFNGSINSVHSYRAQQKTFDLLLAATIAVVTFKVAYRACTILGTVLLQTAPARGSSSGKMEAFLRAMREVCFFVELLPDDE